MRLTAQLEVARKLFLERGYANTSLNDIVARAGGSKATLRKYFGSKAGLFTAVIASGSKRFVFTAHLSDHKGPPARVLRRFGTVLLHFYTSSEALAVYRGVVSEGQKHSPMARAFYKEGHVVVVAALAERLATWHTQGLIRSTDVFDDANQFLHMVRAGIYEQLLIGLRKSITSREITARISRTVKLYLRGLER